MVEAFSQRLSLARLLMIVLVVYVHFPLEVPQVRSVADISPLEPAYIASATVLRFSVTILTIMSGLIMFAKGSDRVGMTTIWRKVRTLVVPFSFLQSHAGSRTVFGATAWALKRAALRFVDH
jgi:membrane-bound acyltransferase YfiQ involved in biofilm formation